MRSAETKIKAVLDHDGTVVETTPILPPPGQGPSARFANLPEHHDGSQFEFHLHFSTNIPELSYRTVGGNLLEVEGGSVIGAARLTRGSNQGWRVSVTPSHKRNIEIRLPVRTCGEPNAICVDNQPLSAPISATVQGMPLTAEFRGVPEEHDGETPFEMQFVLSEDPAGLSYRTVHNNLFDVSGGQIVRAWRLTKGNNTGWGLRVEPSGFAHMSLQVRATTDCNALPGVCTTDGRMLAGGLQATIKGPATLSVNDAETEEEDEGTLDFVVILSRALEETVTVQYRTEDGTAVAGEDYTQTSGTLSFAAGQTSKVVPVQVLDDSHDEGSETMILRLENPSPSRVKLEDAEGTGTINNTDPMPWAWITRFGRMIGSQIVEALTGRLESTRSTHVTLGGVELTGEPIPDEEEERREEVIFKLPEWSDRAKLESENRTMTFEDIVMGSSFHLSTEEQQPGAPAFTAWGEVTTGGFQAEEDEVTLDGDVTTGLLGADAQWDRLLAGVMVSQSKGDGSYRLNTKMGDDEGTVESTMTGVYPYARLELNERVSAWGIVGGGSGELTLQPKDQDPMQTDLGMLMGALGIKGQVLDGSNPSGIGLNMKSDAMWVRTTSERTKGLMEAAGEVSRVRLILEANRPFAMEGGGTLVPSGEIGVRVDGGDAETGTGLEVGAAVQYTAGAITIAGQVRALVAHEESGYKEWGASGAIRVNPDASGKGLTLAVSPTWGNAGSQTSQLWSTGNARALGQGTQFEAGSGLEAELGYGIGVPGTRGIITPYTGLSAAQGAGRTLRGGIKWGIAPGIVLGFEAIREPEAGFDEPKWRKAIEFRTELRW